MALDSRQLDRPAVSLLLQLSLRLGRQIAELTASAPFGYKRRMPVTCSVFAERARAELIVTDPYTFGEFEDAMRVILDLPTLPSRFRLLIDRRTAARPTNSFVSGVVNFFRAHEAHFAGTRAAALVSRSVPEFLPDLRVGRFRIRAFTSPPTLKNFCVRMPIIQGCTAGPSDPCDPVWARPSLSACLSVREDC